MQVITGPMQAGEARGAQAAIAARQRGSSYLYYLLLAGFVVAGMAVAFALRFAVNSVTQHEVVDPGAAIGFGAAIGAFGYTVFCRPYIVKRFRRNMTDRGLAVRFPQTMKLADEIITLDTGAITRTANWSAVTEIIKAKNYWIFMVQMEPWFAPVRFFSDKEAEKAFIRAAISRLSKEARDRSRPAVLFANIGEP